MESVKKNIIYQVSYQVLLILLPLISSPYVSRALGANGVGIYAYTYSIVAYFVLIAKMGIHVYGNRTIATVRDDREKLSQTFWDLYLVHSVIGIIAVILYLLYIVFFVENYKIIAACQSIYVLAEFVEIDWFFAGIEKFKLTVIRNVTVKIITLLCIFIFVNNPNDVWKYCLILALGTFCSQISMWTFLPMYVGRKKANWRNAKKHICPLISFFIPSIAVNLYKVMDKVMLGSISGTEQLGLYENAEKIVNLSLSLVTAVGTVMMPRMTNLLQEKLRKESIVIIENTMHIVMALVMAMTFGIIGIATIFVPVFYGEQFRGSSILLVGLALSMPFTAFANVIRTQYLIPMHVDRVFQGSVISGAIVNVLVNSILIPKYDALGAVIGTVVAEAVVCLIQLVYSCNKLPMKRMIVKVIPMIIIGIIMAILVMWIGGIFMESWFTIILQIVIGGGSYIVIYLLYLFKTKDLLLKKILHIENKHKV